LPTIEAMTLLSRTALVLATLLLLPVGLVSLGASADAATPAARYSRAAVKATNAARHAHDLRRLRTDACLQRYAARQAGRMASQRRMYHQDLGVPMRACGLSMAGENVAYGYRTGRGVVRNGWMRSPGHRANILQPRYRILAVSARKGGDGRWYACQLFGRR
jgi:uncharacterized protein YkwD